MVRLRIYLAATKNKNILEKIIVFKKCTIICASAPSEFLATAALKNKEKVLKKNLCIIQNNLVLLKKFFDKYEDYLIESYIIKQPSVERAYRGYV